MKPKDFNVELQNYGIGQIVLAWWSSIVVPPEVLKGMAPLHPIQRGLRRVENVLTRTIKNDEEE